MTLLDRIAKRLLVAHGRVLEHKTAGSWWTDIRDQVQAADMDVMQINSTKIVFGDKIATLTCEIADDPKSQTVGLQKYAGLPRGHGMIFPYDEPRTVSFHMGTVPFTIDIIFVGSDDRINKIVPDIEPGTQGRWGMGRVSYVIEASGGYCAANGIEVGCEVSTSLSKAAQIEPYQSTQWHQDPEPMTPGDLVESRREVFNGRMYEMMLHVSQEWQRAESGDPRSRNDSALYVADAEITEGHATKGRMVWHVERKFKTLEEAKMHVEKLRHYMDSTPIDKLIGEAEAFNNPMKFVRFQGRKWAQEKYPSYPRKDINPKMVMPNPTLDRFKDHGLPDEVCEDQPMDGAHFDQSIGRDPTHEMLDGPATRAGAKKPLK